MNEHHTFSEEFLFGLREQGGGGAQVLGATPSEPVCFRPRCLGSESAAVFHAAPRLRCISAAAAAAGSPACCIRAAALLDYCCLSSATMSSLIVEISLAVRASESQNTDATGLELQTSSAAAALSLEVKIPSAAPASSYRYHQLPQPRVADTISCRSLELQISSAAAAS